MNNLIQGMTIVYCIVLYNVYEAESHSILLAHQWVTNHESWITFTFDSQETFTDSLLIRH